MILEPKTYYREAKAALPIKSTYFWLTIIWFHSTIFCWETRETTNVKFSSVQPAVSSKFLYTIPLLLSDAVALSAEECSISVITTTRTLQSSSTFRQQNEWYGIEHTCVSLALDIAIAHHSRQDPIGQCRTSGVKISAKRLFSQKEYQRWPLRIHHVS